VVSGTVQCWGANDLGQLGNNGTADSPVPVPVVGITGGAQEVATGDYHSCALMNGSAVCWGYNRYGQLGNHSTTGSAIPVMVGTFSQ
jgi:alpha-tubulin suppressor-like RCC1 family protein